MPMEEFELQMKFITIVTHGLQPVGRVRPLSSENPPTLVGSFISYVSLVVFRLPASYSGLLYFYARMFPTSIPPFPWPHNIPLEKNKKSLAARGIGVRLERNWSTRWLVFRRRPSSVQR